MHFIYEYKQLMNIVNRMSQTLRKKFYNHKVKQLKESNQCSWWQNIKGLIGIEPKSQEARLQGWQTTLLMEIKFFQSVSNDLTLLIEDNKYIYASLTYELHAEYIIAVKRN